MSWRQEGKARCIHNSQPIYPVNSAFRIHHRQWIARFAHLVRCCRMIDSVKTQSYCRQYLLVCRDGEAWINLGSDYDRLDSRRSKCFSCPPVRCDSYLLICRIGEPVRVDERLVCCVSRRDGHVSTGQGRNKGCDEGRILVRIMGRACNIILLQAKVGTHGNVFDLGPVCRESGKPGCCSFGEFCAKFRRNLLPC